MFIPRWQEYHSQVYQYWAATGMPPPLPYAPMRLAPYLASSRIPVAPAPAPSEPTAASLEDRWANHWKAKKAKVTAGPPSKAAAPAPAAPVAPARAPVPSGPSNKTIMTRVLSEMAAEEVFEEVFGAALGRAVGTSVGATWDAYAHPI
jgi:hypothetical protein